MHCNNQFQIRKLIVGVVFITTSLDFAYQALTSKHLAADETSRIISTTSDAEKEEIVFLSARERNIKTVCYLPRTADSSRIYKISSFSPNPLADFQAAVAQAADQTGPAEIVFDGGTYDFTSEDYAILVIRNCQDLKLVGNGSHFIFSSPKTGFLIADSNRVCVSNLRIDYRHRVASFGKIQTNTEGKKVVALSPEYWGQSEESSSYTNVTSIYQRLGSNPFHRQARRRWIQTIPDQSFEFDSETKTYTPNQDSILERFQIGENVTIKHFEYGANAIVLSNCSNVCVENCVASDIPGMFLYSRKVENGVLVRGNIIQPDPDDPLSVVASAADGVHLDSVSKNVIIRNNQFSRMGDDAINLHSNYWHVTENNQPDTVELTYPVEIFEELTILPGSSLQFLSPGLKIRQFALVVDVIELEKKNSYQVVLDRHVESLQVGDLVNVIRWQPKRFVIAHNHFEDFWGRGVLVHARDGLIENNQIMHLSGCGISLTTDNKIFSESGACRDIVISNNLIANAAKSLLSQGRGRLNMGAISITTRVQRGDIDNPLGYSRNFLHGDVLICRNTIRNVGGPGVFLSSARNVELADNSIINHSVVPFSRNRPGSLAGVTEDNGYLDPIFDFHSKNTVINDQ